MSTLSGKYLTREEMYLAAIGGLTEELPQPATRKEQLLAYIAQNGSHGGDPGQSTPISSSDVDDIIDLIS